MMSESRNKFQPKCAKHFLKILIVKSQGRMQKLFEGLSKEFLSEARRLLNLTPQKVCFRDGRISISLTQQHKSDFQARTVNIIFRPFHARINQPNITFVCRAQAERSRSDFMR